MPVKVRIPAVPRPQVGGKSSLEAAPGTLRDVVAELVVTYPSLSEQLLGDEGQLHRFVNVYINDEDIRYLDGLDTKLGDGDVLSILPAVAGGASQLAAPPGAFRRHHRAGRQHPPRRHLQPLPPPRGAAVGPAPGGEPHPPPAGPPP